VWRVTFALDHTQWTHCTRWDFSGRVISPSQRPLCDNTQHSQQTDIHAPSGIRTHNLSKRAAADPLPRPRDPRGRLSYYYKAKRSSAIRYGLHGPRIESRRRRAYPHPFISVLKLTQHPVQRVTALFPGDRAAWSWR